MRLPGRDSVAYDVALGAAIGAAGIIDVAGTADREGALWLNVVVLVVYAGLIAVRRRAPALACFGFVGVLLVLAVALTPPPELPATFLGLLVLPYTAGSLLGGSGGAAALLGTMGAVALANIAGDQSALGDWVFPPVIALAAFLAGRNVVHRAMLAVELHEAGLRAEEERAVEARRAVADERRRIARELHDVVAHSISVMVVQAGGARRIVERDPPRAAQAAGLIERTGRETLEEMRRLLGVMRDPATPAERVPNPTLADVHVLAARAGARLQEVGTPRPVAAGLELGAFRILEEALDGAGPGADVTVTWGADALELDVRGDRAGVTALAGVRERVTLYGGTLDVSDAPPRVHVRLPFEDHDPTPAVPAQGAA